MNLLKNLAYILILAAPLLSVTSCTDDNINPEPDPEIEIADDIDPTLPDEIRNGYSVSFKFGLTRDAFDDPSNTNAALMDIDNFIDLEKVRILFFTCAKYDKDKGKTVADTAHTELSVYNGKPYFTGENDHFLFESKSRWVSKLTDYESTSASYQVTAPVFTYGNNDEYRWEDIRYALENFPFKVVILANRPSEVQFNNFDDKFEGVINYHTGRGPNWDNRDSWIPYERRTEEEKQLSDEDYNKTRYTINDLHHCQWDMVYASKNSGDKNTFSAAGVYSFIVKDPSEDAGKYEYTDPVTKKTYTVIPKPNDFENREDEWGKMNQMGALSNWSEKVDFGDGQGLVNAAIMPSRAQGIPMYGVQVFDPIPDWKKGTPYNVSDRHHGQSGTYFRKIIYLLRSLAKVELKIPKIMTVKNGNTSEKVEIVEVVNPLICYSNVMARCEPLDVATPMERLWKEENWNKTDRSDYCEWKNIFDNGPVIDQSYGQGSVEKFQERMAWFYGAWKDWWHFNFGKSNSKKKPVQGLNPNSTYFNGKGYPYPRIYNPVIQRNNQVRIDRAKIYDEDYHYYVVYTGERNINDPTNFGATNSFDTGSAHVAFFSFSLKDSKKNTEGPYCIAITDYSTNTLIKDPNVYKIDTSGTGVELTNAYRTQMPNSDKGQANWNWPLMRNHVYTFTVNSVGKYTDAGGLDVFVVSSEDRYAPGYWFQ